jgi:hypothetical protein
MTELEPRAGIDRLYELLPYVIRRSDSERGDPLKSLLQMMTREANLLEADLLQLYDNWFIETCEPWVVPYIADLIGHQPIHEAGAPAEDQKALARNAVLLPRGEVANTLRYRRRRGTLALLEQLARDVAGWPALAVEFGQRLAQTQSVRLGRAGRGRSVDLHDTLALDRLGNAFDTMAHAPDLRRAISSRSTGRYGQASVGLYVWRLKPYSITRAAALCMEEVGPNCYMFSVLGNNVPLVNRPHPRGPGCRATGILDVPHAIGLRAFSAPRPPGERTASASTDYYGMADMPDGTQVAQSLAIWAAGWPNDQADDSLPIPASRLIVANLDGWIYQPPRGHVAVDPVLGRIVFPPRQSPRRGVTASYHYGFSADVGGGEYTRPLQQHAKAELIRVGDSDSLRDALKRWQRQVDSDGQAHAPADQPEHAVIELIDSGVYMLPLQIYLGAGHSLQLRAAQRARPVLRLLDWQTSRPDNMMVEGGAGSRLVLDGLTIAGRGVQVEGAIASLTVRHSTLVPGWSLEPNCDPKRPSEPSIEVIDSSACIVVEHSIVGSIQVNNDEVLTDPVRLRISDSIVDATGTDCENPQCEAIGASGSRLAFAAAHIVRSTIIGRVMVHAIELAEDSLFTGRVTVARRQIGCIRFSYVRPGSRTPRRFQCQPDGVERIVEREAKANGDAKELMEAMQQEERLRVRPRFDSLRYGTPTYARLAATCAPEITRGAEDESEMGVYHDLYQPQRLANLASRLEEFSPADADAAVIFAD